MIALVCWFIFLTALSVLDHLGELTNWGRVTSGADDWLLAEQAVLPAVTVFLIWLGTLVRMEPVLLSLDYKGAHFRYKGGRVRSYLWTDSRRAIYLHDIRNRTESLETKPDTPVWAANRIGWELAALTTLALDSYLSFARDYGASIVTIPRKVWWAAFGYITWKGEMIYKIQGQRASRLKA